MIRIVADRNIPRVEEALGDIGSVHLVDGRSLSAERVKQADVLLVRSVTRVDAALLEGSPVQFVATATIGTDHLDTAYLDKAGIPWASAAGSNAQSVAEYILGALLEIAVAREIPLEVARVGIIGFGNVGTRVNRLLRLLGIETLICDPPLQETSPDLADFRPQREVLPHCDFLTLHVPLTPEGPHATRHLLGEAELKLLPRDAWVFNTSRGPVVDNAALHRALTNRKLGGAVLDVWEGEPQILPGLLPLVEFSTPHIAGYSLDGKLNGTDAVVAALREHLGLPPAPPIQRPAGGVSTWRPNSGGTWATLLDAVRSCYDIRRDDKDFKSGADLPEEDWRLHFDHLRAGYPPRREFATHRLAAEGISRDLVQIAAGLGFQVSPG